MNKEAINLISPLEIKIEWSRSTSEPPLTLSISALMLNKEDVIDKIDDFVFYGSKSNGKNIVSSDKAITCDKLDFAKGFGTGSLYTMNLDLDHLRKEIDHIRLVASINLKIHQPQNVSFDNFSKVEFSLKDSIGFHYTVELNQAASPDCRCIEVCLVKRYGKSWRFEEEKVNRLGGLELSYEEYGERLLKENPFSLIGDISKIEWSYEKTVTYTDTKSNKIMGKIKAGVEKFFGSKDQPKDNFFSSSDNFPAQQIKKKENQEASISDSFFQNKEQAVMKVEKDPFFENPAEKPLPKKNKKENFSFGDNLKIKKQECDKDPFFK